LRSHNAAAVWHEEALVFTSVHAARHHQELRFYALRELLPPVDSTPPPGDQRIPLPSWRSIPADWGPSTLAPAGVGPVRQCSALCAARCPLGRGVSHGAMRR
jgi:hypothetical protein